MNIPVRILLIDDSPIVCMVVAHALGEAGYVVDTIDDPRKLAEALSRTTPDVLLVDATFPGIDDAALVALVAPHGASIPVVLFSDRAAGELAALVTKVGARGYVPKDGALLIERLKPYLP